MPHLEFEHWVPFPLERVFAFFSDPENLQRIMPASSQTKVEALNRMPRPAPPQPRKAKPGLRRKSFAARSNLPRIHSVISPATIFVYTARISSQGPFGKSISGGATCHSIAEGCG
jgi:hypothetical protein